MTDIIIGVIANIVRTYAIYCFMHSFFDTKIDRRFEFLAYAGYVLATSGGYYLFYSIPINLITNLGGLFLITFLYRSSILKKVGTVVLIYVVNIVIESIVLFSFSYNQGIRPIMESVCECITSIIILAIANIVERKILTHRNQLQLGNGTWILLSLVPSISIVMVIILILFEPVEYMIVSEMIGLLFINLIIFYLYDAIERYYVQKVESDTFQKKIEIYANELNLTQKSYYNIKALRHDMKHHLLELRYLATQEEASRVVAYLNEMENSIINTKEYASSGNTEIDSTLNYLLREAEEILKKTDIHISLPENMNLHTYHLNIILGNLLENAIDAAKISKEKYLAVDMRVKQGLLYIKITNSYEGIILEKNHQLITSKENKKEHGIGTKNVKQIVDSLNGAINYKWDANRFYVNVMLYMNNA